MRYPYLTAFLFYLMCISGISGAWMLWPSAVPWHLAFWLGWLAAIINGELLKRARRAQI